MYISSLVTITQALLSLGSDGFVKVVPRYLFIYFPCTQNKKRRVEVSTSQPGPYTLPTAEGVYIHFFLGQSHYAVPNPLQLLKYRISGDHHKASRQ